MKENLTKLEKIKAKFGNPFSERKFEASISLEEIKKEFTEGKEVKIAGRLISKREHGRSSFGHIQSGNGKMQVYAQLNRLGNTYTLFKELDIGDIIGIEGKLFKTRTAEPTILIEKLTLLAKSLRPLPEKWHGLKNVEIRYRQRYLDLIANPEVKEIFLKRSQIISFLRKFFNQRNFIEVETPILHLIPGGASGLPFSTYHKATDSQVYLRIAPELYLKRLLVGGLERIYEINKSFRNEGISRRHSPEFTMLESYCAYKDYNYMMQICEELFSSLAKQLHSSLIISYQGKKIDLTPPWIRVSFYELFSREFGVGEDDSPEEVLNKLKAKLKLPSGLTRSQILKLCEDLIEKYYPQDKPAFIIDFFTWSSPLAKTKKDNPNLVERFELFIGGMEVANAYSELNDPLEQRKRFERQMEVEEELPKKIDEDFLTSLEYGMPPAAGLGIGVDRLIMLMLDQPSIKDVILFPLLKPQE